MRGILRRLRTSLWQWRVGSAAECDPPPHPTFTSSSGAKTAAGSCAQAAFWALTGMLAFRSSGTFGSRGCGRKGNHTVAFSHSLSGLVVALDERSTLRAQSKSSSLTLPLLYRAPDGLTGIPLRPDSAPYLAVLPHKVS